MSLSINQGYHSYMLRLRLLPNENRSVWMVSVQNLRTGEITTFPDVDEFLTFFKVEYIGSAEVTQDELSSGDKLLSCSHPGGDIE